MEQQENEEEHFVTQKDVLARMREVEDTLRYDFQATLDDQDKTYCRWRTVLVMMIRVLVLIGFAGWCLYVFIDSMSKYVNEPIKYENNFVRRESTELQHYPPIAVCVMDEWLTLTEYIEPTEYSVCIYSEVPNFHLAGFGKRCSIQALNHTNTINFRNGTEDYSYDVTHRCYVFNSDGVAKTTVSGRMWNQAYFDYQLEDFYIDLSLVGAVGVLNMDTASSVEEAVDTFLADAKYKGLCQFGSLELQSMTYEEMDGSVTVERQDVYEATDTLSCKYDDGSSTVRCNCRFLLQLSHSEEPDLIMTAYLDPPCLLWSELLELNKDQKSKRSKSRKHISIHGFETLRGQVGDESRTQIIQEPDVELETVKEAVKEGNEDSEGMEDSEDQIV